MGRAYNPDVNFELNQTDDGDLISALRAPFSEGHFEGGFALAHCQDPEEECRLSWVVIGTSPDTVQQFLKEKTGPQIAKGGVKHALEDVRSVFELTKAAFDLEQRGRTNRMSDEELARVNDGVPRGCCSNSSGVSVLLVNRPEGSKRFRQVLLTDKFVACEIDKETGFITDLKIRDDPPKDHDPNPGPCKENPPAGQKQSR